MSWRQKGAFCYQSFGERGRLTGGENSSQVRKKTVVDVDETNVDETESGYLILFHI